MTQLIASYELAIGCESAASKSPFSPPREGILFLLRAVYEEKICT